MKRFILATTAAVAFAATGGIANAAVTVTTAPGAGSYTGPAPMYDFDSPATTPSISGGAIVGPGTTSGQYAQPLGSTGQYYSVGPSTSSPGTVTIANPFGVNWVSFIWGSVDTYNTLEVLGVGNTVLATILGGALPPANGNQADANSNPIVTLHFSGADATNFTGLRLSSTSNAFEIDNIAVNAVPEPGTWMMMLLGFVAVGATMRGARRKQDLRVKFT